MSNTLDEILLNIYKEVADLHYNEGAFDPPDIEAKEWLDSNPEYKIHIQALITEKVVKLANLYGEPRCENLHHAKKNQHTSIEDCPVEKAINEQLKENK